MHGIKMGMFKKRGVTEKEERNWQIKNVLFQNCCTGGKTILRMLKLLVKSIITDNFTVLL